jgi:hypothetical protein
MHRAGNRYVAWAVAAILLGVMTYFVTHSFYVWEQKYQEECVNKDLLGWDGNLRFTSVIEYNEDIKGGRPGRAILEILQSPTWPPLRKVISLLLSFFSEFPNPVVDTYISSFFSVLLLGLLPACGWFILRKEEGLWAGAVSGLIVLTMREFPIYSFAAMLETQGMVFLLIACTAYYLNRDAGFASGRGRRYVGWLLLLGFFGLFMTKYPYGMLMLIAAGMLEAMSYTRRFVEFMRRHLLPHYWIRPSLIFPALVLFALFIFAFHGPLGLPEARKFYKQLFYGAVVLAFIDLNVFFYRNGSSVRAVLMRHHIRFYIWAVLPIMIWFLSSPDRFGAFLGAGLHEQDSGRVFLWSLLAETLKNPVLMPLIVAVLLLGLIVIARSRSNLRAWVRDPLNAVILLILFNLLLLELMTANKQFRHIYHLVPALILFSFLVLFRRYRPGHSRPGRVSARGFVGEASGLLLCLGIAGLFVLFPHTMGLAAQRDFVCFTGDQSKPFEPARRVASQIPEGEPVVVWNRFHELDSPAFGRPLASEMDLLIRYRTDGKARNESDYELEGWQRFEYFAYVSYDCGADLLIQVKALVEGRRKVRLEEDTSYTDDSGICLQLFEIQHL